MLFSVLLERCFDRDDFVYYHYADSTAGLMERAAREARSRGVGGVTCLQLFGLQFHQLMTHQCTITLRLQSQAEKFFAQSLDTKMKAPRV